VHGKTGVELLNAVEVVFYFSPNFADYGFISWVGGTDKLIVFEKINGVVSALESCVDGFSESSGQCKVMFVFPVTFYLFGITFVGSGVTFGETQILISAEQVGFSIVVDK